VRSARWLLLLALLGIVAQGAEVYRSKGADGVVIYSDRPENEGSEFVTTVATTHANPAAQRAAAGTTPANPAAGGPNAASAPEAPTAPAPLPPGPTAAELKAQRQKNCDIAREREQRYEVSRRLFRTNDQGEREYLDDKQVAEARAKAAADVKDWCG
jgi:Domain of unknown function (DUF4124)